MKLAVIGGGGVRSLFLAKSIARRAEELHIDELVFMDNDTEKLEKFGGLAAGVAQRLAPELRFSLTADAMEAIKDADQIITTIRVGGDDARVCDERIALDLGILGQETTGAAGFSYAMRSVPALLEYCDLVRRHAKPGAKVFNFTNPAGLVSQALRDAGYDFTYGICDAPSGMMNQFAALYGVSPDEVEGGMYGLNHLSYFQSMKIQGAERMQEIIHNPRAYSETDLRFFEPDLVHHLNCIPNEYLYYFYYREKAVENIMKAGKTRGEQIRDVNKKMQAALQEVDTAKDFDKALAIFEECYGERENNYMASETGVSRGTKWKFDLYAPDDGGYAGVALRYIDLVQKNDHETMILCVPNNGAINGLADDDVVEVSCDISAKGAVPHRFGDVDPRNLELIRRVKCYERLGSRAILKGDRAAAVDCLMLHPLVNSYSLAKRLVEAYYKHNEAYI